MHGSWIILGTVILFLIIIPTSAEEKPIIGAYFFLFDEAYNQAISVSDSIPWDQINRLYIAFATVQDGQITNIDMDNAVGDADVRIRTIVSLCRDKNPDAEIFISSNYGDNVTEEYLKAAEEPRQFADSALLYMQEYDLDGYDMDFETRDINEYVDEQIALLQACNDKFKAPGLLTPRGKQYGLSCTIWPGVHDPETVAALSPYVDHLNLMTYGPGNTYDLNEYANQYAEAGIPFEKMIGGVESEFGYLENGGHDTQESVAGKAEVVKTLGLAGLMNWRMDNDMQTQDGISEEGPPTFQVTGWMFDELTRTTDTSAQS
ncbi:MAG TPA: glycosyl hydrolase family 18 protein [Methanospirillum sp.]|nr:glycosyl hydrolase family 18 protein [Methanospirillum sp.]